MQLFSFIAIIAVTIAQQDPIKDFCRRHQHQTCVIDDKLYIDGGKVYYGHAVQKDSVAQQNTELLWEDVLATDNTTEFPKQFKNLTKTSEVPSVAGGVLWPDTTNKLFYLFGGEYDELSKVQPLTNLWYFDVIYNTWNRTAASDASQAGILWPAYGAGAITEGGTAYYYGGYLSNKSTPRWSGDPFMLTSLISFDMNTLTWSNRTLDNTPRAEGTLHYIPASKSGMLVYFGGRETDTNGGVRLANMTTIHLFDIFDNKWFTQGATGDVPSPRRGACAGLGWADDRTSYNFYVWGGIGEDGAAFDEAYILSLPSFQWTLIWPGLGDIPSTANGKAWSSCNVVRNMSQMIIMGGYLTNTSEPTCDVPTYNGQHGLLLGQESAEVSPPDLAWWYQLWPDYNGYRVPSKIVSLVGGNTSGHATKIAPVQGWATPSMAKYFEGFNYVPQRSATRSLPGTPAVETSSGRPAPKAPDVGAIAGGTIGGVVGLIVLIAIVLLCLRRRRSKQPAHNPSELDTKTTSELGGAVLAQKPMPSYSVSEGGTMLSSTTPTLAYSPQASPPPGTNSWNGSHHYCQPSPGGEWTQTYYPPPPEPSASIQWIDPHEISVELPDVRSPANAEMSEMRSPVNAELPDMRYPVPVRGL